MKNDRIKLDERIIKVLTCALNADSTYTSVGVKFANGVQSIDTLYVSPTGQAGEHLVYSVVPIDEVVNIASRLESVGDIEALILHAEKRKREVLSNINKYKAEAKDLDISLGKLINAKETN